MPTYVYKFVDTGETIEVHQGFQDDTLTEIAHPDSGEVKPVKKVFTPVGVTFKGSGFFKTDNRGKKSATTSSDSSSKDSSSGGDSSKSDSKSDASSGSKSDSGSGSGSGSKSSDSKSSGTTSSTSSTSTSSSKNSD